MAHNHSHPHGSSSNIKVAFFLNVSFALIEIVGGLYTNSLAIISDALHDLGDSFSLGLSWYLEKVAQKKKSKTFSYGYRRFSLLAAFINSLVLIIGSFYILSEAIPRLINPEHSNAAGMMVFAVIGITINGIAVLRMRSGRTMNERVVTWHLLEDVLGWIAVLVVGFLIQLTGIHLLDPVLSILLILYVLKNVVRNFKSTATLFLQSVPENMSTTAIENKLIELPNVESVHDTHVWSLDGENHVLTAHLVVKEHTSDKIKTSLKYKAKQVLVDQFDIHHSTIEIEEVNESCDFEDCE